MTSPNYGSYRKGESYEGEIFLGKYLPELQYHSHMPTDALGRVSTRKIQRTSCRELPLEVDLLEIPKNVLISTTLFD